MSEGEEDKLVDIAEVKGGRRKSIKIFVSQPL